MIVEEEEETQEDSPLQSPTQNKDQQKINKEEEDIIEEEEEGSNHHDELSQNSDIHDNLDNAQILSNHSSCDNSEVVIQPLDEDDEEAAENSGEQKRQASLLEEESLLSQSKDEEEDLSEFPRSPKINGEDEEETLNESVSVEVEVIIPKSKNNSNSNDKTIKKLNDKDIQEIQIEVEKDDGDIDAIIQQLKDNQDSIDSENVDTVEEDIDKFLTDIIASTKEDDDDQVSESTLPDSTTNETNKTNEDKAKQSLDDSKGVSTFTEEDYNDETLNEMTSTLTENREEEDDDVDDLIEAISNLEEEENS